MVPDLDQSHSVIVIGWSTLKSNDLEGGKYNNRGIKRGYWRAQQGHYFSKAAIRTVVLTLGYTVQDHFYLMIEMFCNPELTDIVATSYICLTLNTWNMASETRLQNLKCN